MKRSQLEKFHWKTLTEKSLKACFFSMEMNVYTINIKTTVTWHHDYYVCQGYKKNK